MNKTLRIALSGSGSTGKSTLLKALQSTELASRITFLPEITRSLKEKGFPINEAGNLPTQIMVMNTHTSNLFCYDNFIVDRCLLDGFSYTKWLKDYRNAIPDWFMQYAYNVTTTYLPAYDLIGYLPIEFAAENDGIRSANEEFRQQVDEIMRSFIADNPHLCRNVHEITGSVEERIEKILNITDE